MRAQRSFPTAVVLLLFGPVIAAAHFMVVYLFAEVSCEAGWLPSAILGIPGIAFVALALTVVAAAATIVLTRAAYRSRSGPHGDLAFAGFLLGALFTISIVFVGLPPAFLSPC